MTANEAIEILFAAKWVMSDMGMTLEAREAEDARTVDLLRDGDRVS